MTVETDKDTDVNKTTFGIRPQAPVEVIIDGSYMHSMTRALEFLIDFNKLRNLLRKEYDCRRITYIMKVVYDESGEIMHGTVAKLLDFLRFNGYTLVLGETTERIDNVTGKRSVKQNVDVAITVALMRASHRVNDILLFSGNEDLTYALEECINSAQSPRITLCALPRSCATELRGACDNFVDFAQIKPLVSHEDRRPYDPRANQNNNQAEATVVHDRRGDSTLGGRARFTNRSPAAVDLTAQ